MLTLPSWFMRLYTAWKKTQTPVILPIALTAAGIIVIVFGEDASKAFANLGGSIVIRIMGAFMVAGSCLVISSIVNHNYAREVLGLALLALGTAIYGAGVILGLHTQGLVAGIGYGGITLSLLSRICFLVVAGQKNYQAFKKKSP